MSSHHHHHHHHHHHDISQALRDLKAQRDRLEAELRKTERQIHELEGSYLEETAVFGNVLRGWDGYLSRDLKQQSHDRDRFRKKFKETERLFSLSSVTSPKAVEDASATVCGSEAQGAMKKRRKGTQSSEEEIDVNG